jgi:signal transduction histidine kinase
VAAIGQRTELAITLRAPPRVSLPATRSEAAFRIVQEALGNAVKHARATALAVTLAEADGCLRVTVADNGTGFDPDAPVIGSADGRTGGMGLAGMRERAAAAGLTLAISSAPGAGTRLDVAAPLG